MKRPVFFIILFLISVSPIYAQVDLAPLLASKIKVNNYADFGILIDVAEAEDPECILGDCKNGYSVRYYKLQTKHKNKNTGSRYFNDYYIYLFGDFKDGKLNGSGGIICGTDRVTYFRSKLQEISSGKDFVKINLSCPTPNGKILFGASSKE